MFCLNLSCESNAFQGREICHGSVALVSLNLSCESNAFQGKNDPIECDGALEVLISLARVMLFREL